ncbi:response regulator [Streptomyces sp. TX20-6-3]|uniref:response regulator n=1 Tax=Streptomyces sp. TX20-6-3 TaxID=3028705 RepID=UPI0029AE1A4A|nr:response regulator [Streptomyces sp. TX20-6-3]MDX2558494.1 response regulator [Streptomyces sp. TX20-6-3]
MEALTDRRHRIADLQVQLSQSEASQIESDLRASRELALREEEIDRIRTEKEALEYTVAQLESQLIEAQRRHAEAEARCELLEKELENAESASPTHSITIGDYNKAPLIGKAKIVIADEDTTNASRLEEALAVLEQDVLIASSGISALEIIESNSNVAVILTSHSLGGEIDAYSLTAQIKQGNHRDIPIIFLGVPRGEPHSTFRVYAAGAVDAVDRPVDPWVLRAKVAVFVELHWKTILAQESAALINAMSQNTVEE